MISHQEKDEPVRAPAGGALASTRAGPTVPRIALGTQLRRLREASNLTTAEAAEAIRATHSKISRMERGRTAAKPRDVAGLLTLYGVTDPAERDKLLALTREAGVRGWWRQYSDVVPRWMELYTGLERPPRSSAPMRRSSSTACRRPRLRPQRHRADRPFPRRPARGGRRPVYYLAVPEPDVPDVVYLEQPDDIAGYLVVTDQLCVQAATGAAGKDMLRALRSELWAAPGRRRSLRAHWLRYAVT